MRIIAVASGLLILALGLLQLLLPDLMWRFHTWGKRVEGVKAERTDEWDFWRGCSGVFLVLFGILVAVYGCARSDRSDQTPATRPAPPVHENLLIHADVPPEVREAIRRQLQERESGGRWHSPRRLAGDHG